MQIGTVVTLLLQLLPAIADDVITNVMSPVVSYQFPNDFSSEALTSGGLSSPVVSYQYFNALTESGKTIISPIVSYQYFDWPGDGVLQLKSSPLVSYNYLFSDAPVLTIFQTNREPTFGETTPALLYPFPSPTQLEKFEAGKFTSNPIFPIDKNQMTVVLTHGWNSNPNAWASNMAILILSQASPTPNILAWDWNQAAETSLPRTAAARTKEQGLALGGTLLDKLGTNYSMPIHFAGHSLGTLVNAAAADYVQTKGYSWQNIHMTLFDEAEVADANIFQKITTLPYDFSSPHPFYGQPLPKRYAWADNYVSAFGLPHTNAVNVILTNGLPADAQSFNDWWTALIDFHGYPYLWYGKTMITNGSALGFRWSFEKGGFSGAPSNTTFIQADSELNLVETDFAQATNFLNQRFTNYLGTFLSSTVQPINNLVTANGQVTGVLYATGPGNAWNTLIQLHTGSGNSSPAPNSSPHSLGVKANGAGITTNISACVWLRVAVPSNAVTMSFDFKLQGDGVADSFVMALNGTNTLTLPANQIETNVLINSGAIAVYWLANQTVELFFGIVGCTSTNAQVTVQDISFHNQAVPTLQINTSASAAVVKWPLWANGFRLESTDNLSSTNSWMMVTNASTVVNFQNTFTNENLGTSRFYRLRR